MISKKSKNKAKQIASEYKVNIDFRIKKLSGTASCITSTISINSNRNEEKFFSALFHEIGHIHCYRNRIWPAYHYNGILTWAIAKEFKRTAFRAECWVDRWAKKEMKKYFPMLKFDGSYDFKTKKGKDFLDEYYESFYKQLK
jgi:hypothetical protein